MAADLDVYDDGLTLGEARQRYFSANNFPADGGYEAVWADVKIEPIKTRIRNTAGRKRAVRFHDLHHVLTGYRTTFRGECEIGAWEVATGCADHRAAWVLNLSVFGNGLLFAPRAIWRAFARGRASRNLYRAAYDDALLSRQVGEARRELGLAEPARPAGLGDRLAFAGWSVAALAVFALQVATSPIVLPATALLSRRAPD